MAVQLPRRLFTVDEYHRMGKAGVFRDDERVELLEGEIVPMHPIGSPHAWCVKRLGGVFSTRLIGRYIVSVQDPVVLYKHGEPEPDIALLHPDTPQNRHPTPADILLIIEVADSSITRDRGTKRSMYSRAGIQDYWIVDITGDRIEVYRQAGARGYRSTALLGRGDTISPLCAPDLVIDVATILGNAEDNMDTVQ